MGVRHCFGRLYGADLINTFKDGLANHAHLISDIGIRRTNAPDWSQLGSAAGLGPTTVISGIDGGLEVFAVDTGAGIVWTNWQT